MPSLMQRLKKVFSPKAIQRKFLTSRSFFPSWVRHSFAHHSFIRLVEVSYMINAAVFACVTTLASSFREPRLRGWSENDQGELEMLPANRDPVREIMTRPNPDMGESEFLNFCMTYRALGGCMFVWKQRNEAGRVIALFPFHAGQMVPVATESTTTGFIAYYVLFPDSILDVANADPFGVGRFDNLGGIAIPKQDIVYWRGDVNPIHPHLCMSPLETVANDFGTLNEIGEYVFSLLKNDAMPRVAVTLVAGDDYDEDTVDMLKAKWEDRYGGPNRGTPAFLAAGMTVERISFDLKELAYEALSEVPEANICAAFDVPPEITGLSAGLNNSTYNNRVESRARFTQDTMMQHWRDFADVMQHGFMEEQGFGGVLWRFNLTTVAALQQNVDEVHARAREDYNAGIITRSEARQQIGLPVTDVDEVYKVGLSTLLIPADESPAPLVIEGQSNRQLPAPKNHDEAWALLESGTTPKVTATG